MYAGGPSREQLSPLPRTESCKVMVMQPEAVPMDASWTNLLIQGAAMGKRQQTGL